MLLFINKINYVHLELYIVNYRIWQNIRGGCPWNVEND